MQSPKDLEKALLAVERDIKEEEGVLKKWENSLRALYQLRQNKEINTPEKAFDFIVYLDIMPVLQFIREAVEGHRKKVPDINPQLIEIGINSLKDAMRKFFSVHYQSTAKRVHGKTYSSYYLSAEHGTGAVLLGAVEGAGYPKISYYYTMLSDEDLEFYGIIYKKALEDLMEGRENAFFGLPPKVRGNERIRKRIEPVAQKFLECLMSDEPEKEFKTGIAKTERTLNELRKEKKRLQKANDRAEERIRVAQIEALGEKRRTVLGLHKKLLEDEPDAKLQEGVDKATEEQLDEWIADLRKRVFSYAAIKDAAKEHEKKKEELNELRKRAKEANATAIAEMCHAIATSLAGGEISTSELDLVVSTTTVDLNTLLRKRDELLEEIAGQRDLWEVQKRNRMATAQHYIDRLEKAERSIKKNLVKDTLRSAAAEIEKVANALYRTKDFLRWYNRLLASVRDYPLLNAYLKNAPKLMAEEKFDDVEELVNRIMLVLDNAPNMSENEKGRLLSLASDLRLDAFASEFKKMEKRMAEAETDPTEQEIRSLKKDLNIVTWSDERIAERMDSVFYAMGESGNGKREFERLLKTRRWRNPATHRAKHIFEALYNVRVTVAGGTGGELVVALDSSQVGRLKDFLELYDKIKGR
ncbi:MAG: hypothetical protein ABH829_00865 [archaeon]